MDMDIDTPFSVRGRDTARLLFDFGVALACLSPEGGDKVLDFACGTGWTSEFLNCAGYDVYGIDINEGFIRAAEKRPQRTQRIAPARLHFTVGDGHKLPYADRFFGNILTFDSLHHMKDYPGVIGEMARVLKEGGRAVFIEPGSRHSTSPETLRYLKENPRGDWWIERDVDLMEIRTLAQAAGFRELYVKPFFLPSMSTYSFVDWYHILDNPAGLSNHMTELRRFAYEDRVCFYLVR